MAVADDEVPSLKEFKARNKVTYPIAVDQGDRLFNRFNMGIPSTVLIDTQGVIRHIEAVYTPKNFALAKARYIKLLPKKR